MCETRTPPKAYLSFVFLWIIHNQSDISHRHRGDVEKQKRKVEGDLKLTQEAVADLERNKKELEQTIQRKDKEVASLTAKLEDEQGLVGECCVYSLWFEGDGRLTMFWGPIFNSVGLLWHTVYHISNLLDQTSLLVSDELENQFPLFSTKPHMKSHT